MVTPTISDEDLKGSLIHNDLSVDWNITDDGATGNCAFKITFGDGVDSKIQVQINKRDGSELKNIDKTEDQSFICSDLIDAEYNLMQKESFGRHKVLESWSINSLNGHTV